LITLHRIEGQIDQTARPTPRLPTQPQLAELTEAYQARRVLYGNRSIAGTATTSPSSHTYTRASGA